VIGYQRVTGGRRLAAEPAEFLLGQNLLAQLLVGMAETALRRAPTALAAHTVVLALAVGAATTSARRRVGPKATRATKWATLSSDPHRGEKTRLRWGLGDAQTASSVSPLAPSQRRGDRARRVRASLGVASPRQARRLADRQQNGGPPACRGLRMRPTMRPPSKSSTAPSKSSPRGTGSCLPAVR
jgi:hypothetical protein